MNKKWVVLGVGAALGSTLLLTSAYAGMNEAEGYEALKQAVRTTKQASSVTTALEVTVRDNGNPVVKVAAAGKADREREAASAAVTVDGGGKQSAWNVYHAEEKTILKSSDSEEYTVIDKDGKHRGFHRRGGQDNPELAQEMENVVDALVGDLKHYVSVSKLPDGGKKIGLDLRGQQIPAVVRAAGSLAVKAASSRQAEEGFAGHHRDFPGLPAHADLHQQLPQLSQSVAVERIRLQMNVDEAGYITGKTAELTVTGQDADGGAHEVVVALDAAFSGYGATVPDTIDLEGKPVRKLDPDAMKSGHR